MKFDFKIAGDQSILVQFGKEISDETSKSVRRLAELVESRHINGIEEVILGYTNLLINYNPAKIPYDKLLTTVEGLIDEIDITESKEHNVIEIPVLYGSEWGPDLQEVAKINQMTEEEVIQIHTEPSYTVYFIGFTPGFPFLGGLSEKIATPRLPDPRTRITAGSVGIANNQTGIYPVSSPGGWRLIGHTPVPLYNPDKEKPFLLSPGDMIKFRSVTRNEYEDIKQKHQS